MNLRQILAIGAMIVMAGVAPAGAQKAGGLLQAAHRDSPASMSTLEEVTISTVAPMMAVFNNLVIFDQHVPQNTLQSIVPDLATSWSEVSQSELTDFAGIIKTEFDSGRRSTSNG